MSASPLNRRGALHVRHDHGTVGPSDGGSATSAGRPIGLSTAGQQIEVVDRLDREHDAAAPRRLASPHGTRSPARVRTRCASTWDRANRSAATDTIRACGNWKQSVARLRAWSITARARRDRSGTMDARLLQLGDEP